MDAAPALDTLLASRRLWRGRPATLPADGLATGHVALDAVLPRGGWPPAGLVEVLVDQPGCGELRLLLPTLARCTERGRVLLVAPPALPYPPGWGGAGIDVRRVGVVEAAPRDVPWTAEQCLRSGAVAAVLVWPGRVADHVLRRLQVAAETGHALGFVFRTPHAARQPSPAPLRIAVERERLRILKCRGGFAPAAPIPFPPPQA